MGREGRTDKRCHLLSIKTSPSPELGRIQLCSIPKLWVLPGGTGNSIPLEKGAGPALLGMGKAAHPKRRQKTTRGLWGKCPTGHSLSPLQPWEPR